MRGQRELCTHCPKREINGHRVRTKNEPTQEWQMMCRGPCAEKTVWIGSVWSAERHHAANRNKHSELITVRKIYDTHAIRSNKTEHRTLSVCFMFCNMHFVGISFFSASAGFALHAMQFDRSLYHSVETSNSEISG